MATYTEEKQHLSFAELYQRPIEHNQYLEKLSPEHEYKIPAYPRPELHVTHISHSTDLKGLQGIRADGGFRDPNNGQPNVAQMVWFNLTVTPKDLSDAETRDMKIIKPGGVEEEFRAIRRGGGEEEEGRRGGKEDGGAEGPGAGGGVLQKFASSPAFSSSSRYGSYRLTFDVRDVLRQFSEQFCRARPPVMRTWKTELYKKEVMYAALVHSPLHNDRFSQLPLLEDTPHSICAFRDGPEPHFLWRPQAMCKTHSLELLDSGDTVSVPEVRQQFFVWDHVALVLVVDDQVLRFPEKKLRTSLRFCVKRECSVESPKTYESHDDANRAVQDLWPGSGDLEKFDQSLLHISTL